MFNIFTTYRQHRLARKIAAAHGLLAEYEAARRFGLSPIEALNDWDMLTEETRKQFQ